MGPIILVVWLQSDNIQQALRKFSETAKGWYWNTPIFKMGISPIHNSGNTRNEFLEIFSEIFPRNI